MRGSFRIAPRDRDRVEVRVADVHPIGSLNDSRVNADDVGRSPEPLSQASGPSRRSADGTLRHVLDEGPSRLGRENQSVDPYQ